MRYIIMLVAACAIIISGIYGIGSTLPDKFTTVRTASYSQPIEIVWNTLTDVKRIPEWSPWVSSAEKMTQVDGAIWRVANAKGQYMEFKMIDVSRPSHFISRTIRTDLPYRCEWVFELTQNKDKTQVKITDNAEVKNPFYRFLFRYVYGNDKPSKDYLQALGNRFGETTIVEQ